MNKLLACTLILACLAAASLAAADNDEEQSDIDVFVTASRVEEPAEEVPAYVTVITDEELDASGQTTLVDALEGLAGLHFRTFSSNAVLAEVSMGGFGENSHGRVLVLLDGRRLNRPDMASVNWLEIPIESVERVEVVRGGASVLYGDNAVAGVINIITRQEQPEGFGFRVSGQYGSFNQNQERGEVSGSIGPVSISASAEHSATDGFRERSAYRSLGGGIDLGLDLDRFSSSLALSYNRLFYELPGALTEAQYDSVPAQSVNPMDESNNQYLNADLGFAAGSGEDWLLDGNLSYGMKFIASDMASWSSFSDLLLNTVALTPKLRMDMDVLAGSRLVGGVDGYLDRLNLKTYLDAQRTSVTQESVVTKATFGAYVTDELALLPMLKVNGGLRYDLGWIAFETLSGAPFQDGKLLQNLVYEVGLLLSPGSSSRVWLKHGRVFRYPAVDEIANLYGLLSSPFNTDLRPEKGVNFELGGEVSLARVLRLAANAFWLDMEDEIAYDEVAFLNVNLEKTRRIGAEAELGVRISSWFELAGNYTYTYAVFREGANAGNVIPLVPAHQASGKATVSLPAGFSAAVTGQFVGEQFLSGDPANAEPAIPGYFLLGGSVGFRPAFVPGELEVQFGVENILDTVYASTGFYDKWTPEHYYYPGAGRSWKLGASYRY